MSDKMFNEDIPCFQMLCEMYYPTICLHMSMQLEPVVKYFMKTKSR